MKPSTELARMSALLPSGSWNFTAIERTLGTPSCTAGFPLPLANRMVVGTDWPSKCGARVTRGASAEARNIPEQTRPLAWTGRKPGCGPASVLMASTIWRMTSSGVAAVVMCVLLVSQLEALVPGGLGAGAYRGHADIQQVRLARGDGVDAPGFAEHHEVDLGVSEIDLGILLLLGHFPAEGVEVGPHLLVVEIVQTM